MLEYAEIELGGQKRKGRISWDQLKLARMAVAGFDPYLALRNLVSDDHVIDFLGLEILLWAALSTYDRELTLGMVRDLIAQCDCDEQARANAAYTAATALMKTNASALEAQLQAGLGGEKVTPVVPLTWQAAYTQVYEAQPELKPTDERGEPKPPAIGALALFVIAARRAGGVPMEARPNVQRPALH